MVTPDKGGILTSADRRLTITVPPGAVTMPTEVWVDEVPKPQAMRDFPDAVPAGVVYELGPDGQRFAVPLRVAFSLAMAEVRTARGVPLMALYSRSATGPEEPLHSAMVDGLAIDPPAPVTRADFAKGTVVIHGDANHFSWIHATERLGPSEAGGLYGQYGPTEVDVCVGDTFATTATMTRYADGTSPPPPIVNNGWLHTLGAFDLATMARASLDGQTKDGNQVRVEAEFKCVSPVDPGAFGVHVPILPPPGSSATGVRVFQGLGSATCMACAADTSGAGGTSGADAPSAADRPQTGGESDAGVVPKGFPCGSGCASGLTCIDGVCCEKPTCGVCERCNHPNYLGTCVDSPSGQPDPDSCPAPKECHYWSLRPVDGGQREAYNKCKVPLGYACKPDGWQGGYYNESTECIMGRPCIDGVCCNSTCAYGGMPVPCRGCIQSKTGLADGTCGSVMNGMSGAGVACNAPMSCQMGLCR